MNISPQDMLLSEIVTGESIGRSWSQWSIAAEADPALWRRLAEAQRDELALVRSMHQASLTADGVDAPNRHAQEIVVLPMKSSRPVFWSWAGWSLAAAVMIVAAVWKLQVPPAQPAGTSTSANTQSASLAPAPEDLFRQWIESGKQQGTVIGELPQRIVLDARPADDGIGYDVTYLRQIQERTRVPDLYQAVGQDERGRAQLVSYEPPAGNPM